jgi:hypothetical protein
MSRPAQVSSKPAFEPPFKRPADRRSTGAASFISLWLLAAVALGLAFWLYAQPGVMVMLAEQLWSCF